MRRHAQPLRRELWWVPPAALVMAASCGIGAPGDGAPGTAKAIAKGGADPGPPAETRPHRPARRALVIGIGDYSASRLPAVPRPDGRPAVDREWRDLAGPVNDAHAIREALIGRFGLAPEDVLLLLDQDATREAILGAIRRHLVEPAGEGDELVFYFAGHGSLVRNSARGEANGMDESLVPADSRKGALDVRDKELRRLLNGALDRGARLTVILDSCHSSSGVRGFDERRARGLRVDPRDVADATDPGPELESRDAVVLAAAQDFELALETWDAEHGRYHGAFTLSLLHALRAAQPGESTNALFQRTRAWLHGPLGMRQEPSKAGRSENLERPLFGTAERTADGRPLAAIEKVEEDGRVVLQAGWIHGLAVGSELEATGGESEAAPQRLRVTELDGLARSRAEVVIERTPRTDHRTREKREARPGQLFALAGWTVIQGPPLQVAVVTAGAAALDEAVELVRSAAAAGLALSDDPTSGLPPTRFVSRRDDGWHLAADGPIERLENAGPAAVLERLAEEKGAAPRVFVDLPAPAALVDELAAEIEGRKVEIAGDPGRAEYVLAGRWHEGALEVAWTRPGATSLDEARSSLPLRSRWRRLDGTPQSLAAVARGLASDAARLARVRDWVRLAEESPPAGDFPYRLTLRQNLPGAAARSEGELVESDLYALELAAPPERLEEGILRRYVYAFVVDGSGACSLLHPRPEHGNVENRFPLKELPPHPPVIRLGQDLLIEVTEPFGLDNYYLLSTVEPVTDPSVLECAAVRGSHPGPPSALEELLEATGELTRGSKVRAPQTPRTWSLQRLTFQSRPRPRD